MVCYRIHVPLQDFEGAKSGRAHTCTRETLIEAPEGEFKELPRGAYSRAATSEPDTDSTAEPTTNDNAES